MTDYKNELEKALEKLKFTVLNRKVTEKDWESEIFFEVTSEFKATIEALLSKRELEIKQKLAMCLDDKTFLEEHKFANVIEYDTKLKRPSRAIYHNRQWEAERDGLNTLAALGEQIERDQLTNREEK